MIGALFSLAKPALHALDAETAHQLTIRALSLLPVERRAAGRSAAGRRRVRPALPQSGRPRGGLRQAMRGARSASRPRLRLRRTRRRRAEAAGGQSPPAGVPARRGTRRSSTASASTATASMRRAGASCSRRGRPGIVGVNIGANKDSADRIADYVPCIERLCGLADFLTINVSSPNTPGLRDLQGEAFLDDLLARSIEARDKADQGQAQDDHPPEDRAGHLARYARRHRRDGPQARHRWADRFQHHRRPARQPEGEGAGRGDRRPLGQAALRALDEAARRDLPAGGAPDPAHRRRRRRFRGDRLGEDPRRRQPVQLYSAMVYKGPGLVGEIKRGLRADARQPRRRR